MAQEFKTGIDLKGNPIINAGLEVVTELPTTNLVDGREVIFQGEVLRYLNGEWHIDSFSAYTLKTYAELKELKDNNALVTGSFYVLTDFYTTYLAEDQETWLGGPDCEVIDHLGNPIVSDNYQIVLTAVSKNQFAVDVSILNDTTSTKIYLHTMSKWAVQFDFDLDLFGRIVYMHEIETNNTFDFDIFNVRWHWKGYQINLIPYAIDLTVFGGKLEPEADYYLWTIGDLEVCYGTLFNPYEQFKGKVFYNISISGSSQIFIYAHSKTIPTSFWDLYVFDVIVSRCHFLTSGKEFFNCRFVDSKHIYLRDWANHSNITNSSYVFTPFHARGVIMGFEKGIDDDENCTFFSSFMPNTAFLVHSILRGRECVFLSKKCAFPIIQKSDTNTLYLNNIAIVNNNSIGPGVSNISVTFDSPTSNCEIIVPDLIKNLNLSAKSLTNIQVSLPIIESLELNTLWYKLFCNEKEQVFLRYLDSNNEEINTEITDTTSLNNPFVKFYEEYITPVNYSYYMPFCAFGGSPTEWGYEIDGMKYATSKTYPIYACFFMNTGSNTSAYAGQTLKFYVILNNETYYSNSYNINTNNTLTLI